MSTYGARLTDRVLRYLDHDEHDANQSYQLLSHIGPVDRAGLWIFQLIDQSRKWNPFVVVQKGQIIGVGFRRIACGSLKLICQGINLPLDKPFKEMNLVVT